MEENYCIDTLAGQLDCVTTLAPQFAEAMSSADFPWGNALLAVMMIVIYTL